MKTVLERNDNIRIETEFGPIQISITEGKGLNMFIDVKKGLDHNVIENEYGMMIGVWKP